MSKVDTLEHHLLHYTYSKPVLSEDQEPCTKRLGSERTRLYVDLFERNFPDVQGHRCIYLEKRHQRLEARKQWNHQIDALLDSHPKRNQISNFKAGRIHSVDIDDSDDQYLFELGLKLRFGAEPDAVANAISELARCAVLDFHPQIFIQKPTLMVERFLFCIFRFDLESGIGLYEKWCPWKRHCARWDPISKAFSAPA